MVEACAVSLMVACEGNVVAVTRRDPELISVLNASGCQVVIHDNADQGMGTSIAAGIAATQTVRGWMIALGDMPFIRVDTLVAVVDMVRGGSRIAVPAVAGKRGHPVGFSAHYRAQLLALKGNNGAREILIADASFIDEVCVDDVGIFVDIDTPTDLKRQNFD